jgi:hypothetical protein
MNIIIEDETGHYILDISDISRINKPDRDDDFKLEFKSHDDHWILAKNFTKGDSLIIYDIILGFMIRPLQDVNVLLQTELDKRLENSITI